MDAMSLDFVSLQVKDLDASRRFYTEQLGFRAQPQHRPDAVVFEGAGGAIFAIRAPLVDLDAVDRRGWGAALWFAVPDVEALYARAAGAGIPILQPLQDSPFGRVFTLADPDDYGLTFHQAS
jgi:predicted enzyme related to lactoylglutathione lyase